MIPTLRTDKRILEDWKRYQEQIDKVTDENLKEELTSLLRQLKEYVGHIDRNHEQLYLSGRMPSEISEIRASIVSTRKSLDSKIDTWTRSQYGLLKPAPHPNVE